MGEGRKKSVARMAELRDVRGMAAQTGRDRDQESRRGQDMDRVECRAERKVSRSQGICITGAGRNAIQGELGAEG